MKQEYDEIVQSKWRSFLLSIIILLIMLANRIEKCDEYIERKKRLRVNVRSKKKREETKNFKLYFKRVPSLIIFWLFGCGDKFVRTYKNGKAPCTVQCPPHLVSMFLAVSQLPT